MLNLTLHNLDAGLVAELRQRARAHGCSIAEEAVHILEQDLGHAPSAPARAEPHIIDAIRAVVADMGGIDTALPLPARDLMREPPHFD
jgi:plasmid stability protein